MAISNKNGFDYLSADEIKESFDEITYNALAPFILPVLITLDLSSGMTSYVKASINILSIICETLSSYTCPLDTFLILSVVNDCYSKTDSPKVIYSGFIEEFDCDLFVKEIKDCYGFAPIASVLNQMAVYGNMAIEKMDSMERVHSCPINILITSSIEDNQISEFNMRRNGNQEINIAFTFDDCSSLIKQELFDWYLFCGVTKNCDASIVYDILYTITMTMEEPTTYEDIPPTVSRCDTKEYNNHFNKKLMYRMQEYWDKYYI